jgi:3',5'-cyclic AMP phosphodiesterase CpdA
VTRFVVAHLSDCHIGATAEAPARLRRALDHVAACTPQPDVLLLSGDLTDHGLDVEYEVAAELLSTVTIPLVACPGNHDVRTRFVHHLGPAESVIDVAGYRLIALNSLVDAAEGERIDHGELTEDSLRLLHQALTAGRPTFVGLHHPPVDLHVDMMDPIKLTTAQSLVKIEDPGGLDRKPRVAGEDPGPVLPRLDRILVQPAPHGRGRHRRHQTLGDRPGGQLHGGPPRQRHLPLRRRLAGQP